MGLAASQARLLTITARKADCEFQSMKLSHEKIALSRDMERISDEYQNAMNQTKLIYDYYGTGTSDMSLTYGLLMTPSVYNDYYPRLLTDKSNRVVLSGIYASAARAAGIPAEGYNGTPSSEVRNSFVEALRDLGVISASTAVNIESVSYNNGIGLGATFSATAATTDITFQELKDMIKSSCIDTRDAGLHMGGKIPSSSYPQTDLPWDYHTDTKENTGCRLYIYDNTDSTDYTTRIKGDDDTTGAITLYDLLNDTNQYVISYDGGYGPTKPLREAAYAQQALVGSENSPSFLNWLVDQFVSILGGVNENDLALQYAYNQVYDLIYPNEVIQETAQKWLNEFGEPGGDNEDKSDFTKHNKDQASEKLSVIGTDVANSFDSDERNKVAREAMQYIGFTWSGCYHDPCGHHQDTVSSIAISLNSITDIFMTAFVEYMNGIDNSQYSYNVGINTNSNLWTPDDEYIFKIKAPTDVTDGTDNLLAGFYDALFNRICVSGWTENDNIESVEYMQELMKSGAVYISSINNDGNYYQSGYSTDTYIAEVADLEGVAQAEAKYNAAKAKIEHKENTIDMKMKNLDTEISSLTTEYDAVKGIISKTVEKSFKRYDA